MMRFKPGPTSMKLLLLISVSILSSCSKDYEKVAIIDLQCAYLKNPIGIDVTSPRLSWKITSKQNNINQHAYQILVASDRQLLEKSIGDLWDTEKQASDESIQIEYWGKELKSRDKAYWKVKIWDQNNKESSWSEVATWEMGLLDQSDWQASWIGVKEKNKPVVGQRNPAPYFRKSVTINNDLANARAYISGLGYYELYINGKKVGDHVLSPNQTNYDRRQVNSYREGQITNMSTRVLYETFDISNYLQKGENTIGVILGNGWYYQTTRIEYFPLFYDSPRFIAQLELDYPDNSKQIIVSDETWKTGKGPILNNNLHHGEIYDARLENKGWNSNGFDDSHWSSADIVRAPEGVLKAQMSPPDRVVNTIHPVSFFKKEDSTYRYDFGTMFSGWVKLNIQGKKGEEVKLTFFEDTGNTYEQSDTYILKGDGLESWEPRFTWHSFRYVEVSGASSELSLSTIEGRVVNTDVKSTGTFASSNELFNQVNEDFKKTQLGNMHGGVPTDCPHRERRGYTGDGQIAAQAAIYNFDMQSFYTKWIHDIADAQDKETGYVPNTVPFHSGGGGTPWGSAYIIIPWYMYVYYGDTAILESHFEGMKLYANYLTSITDADGLIVEKELGEWVPPEKTEIPPSFVSSAYYYYDLMLLEKMATILGEKADADSFLAIAEGVKKSFNQRYYNSKSASYSIGRQGANVFPLAFGLVPEAHIDKVFQSLVHHVEVNTKGHFDTGMMGTPYLLEVLTKNGRPDLAYTVMNRRDFPSFGYNIERGATTLWETWSGNDSHSHPMFGSVCAWFFHGLGGINPDPSQPGFKHTIIKPAIINELDFANTTYPSVHGDIVSNWVLKDGDLNLTISVPPNTSASIFVPGNQVEISKGGDSNVILVGEEDGHMHYEVPSGSYTFFSKDIDELLTSPMLSIPVIDPSYLTLFSPDSLEVNIRQYAKNAEIRYTLDGSEPNENSLIFTKPFMLYESTFINAKVFRAGSEPGFTANGKVVFIDPVKNGIGYEYYLGAWNKLPNYNKLIPQKTGKVYNISLDEFDELDNQFGIRFSAQLEIKNSGIYTFYLVSNDGSKLFIDNNLVVDADGSHSFSGTSGKANLTKGRHEFMLEYFQAGGGKGLDLEYEGPNTERQRIPSDALFFGIIE